MHTSTLQRSNIWREVARNTSASQNRANVVGFMVGRCQALQQGFWNYLGNSNCDLPAGSVHLIRVAQSVLGGKSDSNKIRHVLFKQKPWPYLNSSYQARSIMNQCKSWYVPTTISSCHPILKRWMFHEMRRVRRCSLFQKPSADC